MNVISVHLEDIVLIKVDNNRDACELFIQIKRKLAIAIETEIHENKKQKNALEPILSFPRETQHPTGDPQHPHTYGTNSSECLFVQLIAHYLRLCVRRDRE